MRSQSCIQDLLVVVVEAEFLGESETKFAPALESDLGGLAENFVDVHTGRREVVNDALEFRVELEDSFCGLNENQGSVN
jgi:hypothetical protein